MSTDYRLEKCVRAADVLDGRLTAFGVWEQLSEYATEESKCLTDGRNCIWLYINDGGFVCSLSAYVASSPSRILRAISTVFDTEIFSEHEPQFYGCDSEEELQAAMDQMCKEPERNTGAPDEIDDELDARVAAMLSTLEDKMGRA